MWVTYQFKLLGLMIHDMVLHCPHLKRKWLLMFMTLQGYFISQRFHFGGSNCPFPMGL